MFCSIIFSIVLVIIAVFIFRYLFHLQKGTVDGPLDKLVEKGFKTGIDIFEGTSHPPQHITPSTSYVSEFEQRRKFWAGLIEKSREKGKRIDFNNVEGIDFGSYRFLIIPRKKTYEISYRYVLNKNSSMIQLFFDSGISDVNEKQYFRLKKYKEPIDREFQKLFNGKIKWEYIPYERVPKLLVWFGIGWNIYSEDKWDNVQYELIDAMDALEKTTKKYFWPIDRYF